MNVCHITTAHSALDTRIFYREAKSLSKAGYKVHVVGMHRKREIVDGIEIIPIMPAKNRLLRMGQKPFKVMLLSLKTGSEICHFHDPELIPVGLILKLLGKKVVYDAHEDYPKLIKVKDWLPGPAKPILSWATNILERFASGFFDLTFAPSEPLSRRLPKGIALYNFPTVDILNLLKKHSRPYKERDIDLIHVGVLRKARIDFFVDVLKKIYSENALIKTAFVGLSNEQIYYIKEKLGSFIDDIILKEKLPFNEVAKLLGRSKVGINYHPIDPHLKYAVPVKIFEYFGAGCIVVTAEFPFLKTILSDNDFVFFTSHKPQKFAEVIMKLINDPTKCEKFGRLSQEYSSKFSWETEKQKLIESYERLL